MDIAWYEWYRMHPQVKSKSPSTQFMMFPVYENDEKVIDAIKAGTSGYLLKNTGVI